MFETIWSLRFSVKSMCVDSEQDKRFAAVLTNWSWLGSERHGWYFEIKSSFFHIFDGFEAKGSNSTVAKLPGSWFQGKIASCLVVDSVDSWEMLVNWKPRRSLFWYLARITWPPDLYLQDGQWGVGSVFFQATFLEKHTLKLNVSILHPALSYTWPRAEDGIWCQRPALQRGVTISVQFTLSLSFSCFAVAGGDEMLAPKRLQSHQEAHGTAEANRLSRPLRLFNRPSRQGKLTADDTEFIWDEQVVRMWMMPSLVKSWRMAISGWVIDS